MSKHTKEPWMVHIQKDGGNHRYDIRTVKPHAPGTQLGSHIAKINAFLEAEGHQGGNANRIVSCVNAMAGIEEPSKLRKQRDDLLEALQDIMLMRDVSKPRKLDDALTWKENDELAESKARAAIAKAKDE